MNYILEQLNLIGIIPVVVIDEAINSEPLAQALYEGGLPTMEITFRTKAATDAISIVAKRYPDIVLGAGTVIQVDQVKTAMDCGAKFIVSPGLHRKVIEYCLSNEIIIIPGILTPTEIGEALNLGIEVMKFFPAEASGGIEYLKAISAPYKNVKFIPTGGLDESNILQYLKLPQVFACGGSWMVKADLIKNKRFEDIKNLTSSALSKMFGFRLLNIGISDKESKRVTQAALFLSKIINLQINDDDSLPLISNQFELIKSISNSKRKNISIGTYFLDRAVHYLLSRGLLKKEFITKVNDRISIIHLNVNNDDYAIQLLQL